MFESKYTKYENKNAIKRVLTFINWASRIFQLMSSVALFHQLDSAWPLEWRLGIRRLGSPCWSQEMGWSFQNRDDTSILFAKNHHLSVKAKRKSSNLSHLCPLVFDFIICHHLPSFSQLRDFLFTICLFKKRQ